MAFSAVNEQDEIFSSRCSSDDSVHVNLQDIKSYRGQHIALRSIHDQTADNIENPRSNLLNAGFSIGHRSSLLFVSDTSCSIHVSTFTHPRPNASKAKKYSKKSEVFNEWLAAKVEAEKHAKQKKMEKQEKLQKEKEIEHEMHCQLKETKIKDWLKKKREADGFRKEKLKLESEAKAKHNNDIDPNAQLMCFNAWLSKKMDKEKLVKNKQSKVERQKWDNVKQRKEKAQKEYEKWLKTARHKTKPVPLNQGLLSLKGTISKLYINPVPWVSDLDEQTRTP